MDLLLFLMSMILVVLAISAIVPTFRYAKQWFRYAKQRKERGEREGETIREYRFSKDLFDAEWPSDMGIATPVMTDDEQESDRHATR